MIIVLRTKIIVNHTQKGPTVPSTQDPTTGTRRGIAKTLTLDVEAARILDQFSFGAHTQGRVISELLKQEALRREERTRLKAKVLAVFDADGSEAVTP
jgi:hypothetical protein